METGLPPARQACTFLAQARESHSVPRRTLILLLVSIAVGYVCYWRADRTPYARYLAEALELVDQNYVEPVDNQKLFDGAMQGMVGCLDDYSAFVSREDAAQFQQTLDQKFGGIGIEVLLDPKTSRITIATPIPNTPAFRAGIRPGDTIVSIDGQQVDSFPAKERRKMTINLLRGKEGEAVVLGILHPGENAPVEYKLVRATIPVDYVLGDHRDADNSWNFLLTGHAHIGYVRITSFGKQTVQEFTAAMDWLSKHGCRALVIDLRNNPGGLLDSACEICDLFIGAGQVIVTTRDREGQIREKYEGTGRGPYQQLPIVLLVDHESASASEIVAACLKDHGRAKIVGQRTWGKGTVQHAIPIEGDKSVLRLTTASYWRPNGQNIHRFRQSRDSDPWGVSPDAGCEVALSEQQLIAWMEARRQCDVVYPPGTSPPDRQSVDATSFDPVLKRAVAILDEAGSTEKAATAASSQP